MTFEELKKRVEPWLDPCGPCDYGVMEVGCSCPPGDPRVPMSMLWQAYEELHRKVTDDKGA